MVLKVEWVKNDVYYWFFYFYYFIREDKYFLCVVIEIVLLRYRIVKY